jgi:hypothetical protein
MAGTIWNFLAGPRGSPFRLHNTRRTGKQLVLGTRGHAHFTWEKKELPDAGAGQYAWETYGLPPYARFGFGNIQVQNPLRETFPASYVFQAVGIVGNPPTSMVQGQFVTQPLMDPDTAANIGVVTPGAVNAGPNAITNSAPILSP